MVASLPVVALQGRQVRPRWVLAAVCMSVVIVSLDTTIVNVALAQISEDLGASTTELQWVPDAYLVVYAGLLLLAGAIGDRIGHKPLLAAGLVFFGGGSAMSSLSGSVGVLIAWRAVMGVGAAAIMPASLALLTSVFTGERRALALGFWSAAAGGGAAAGPLIGGVLLFEWSWRAVFLVNVPLVAVALAADAWALSDTAHERRTFDLAGAALSTIAIVAVTAAVIESSTWGWLSARVLVLYVTGAVAGAGFVLRQRRAKTPLIDLSWFGDRRLSVPCTVAGGLFFAMTGASFVLMLYLQLVLGYSPLIAGAAILPAVALTMIAAPLAGAAVNTVGARTLMAVGMGFLAAGLGLFATLTAHSTYWPFILIAGSLFGIGIGLALTPASDAVMGSRASQRPGVASGIIETVEEVASALGIAVVGAVVTSRFAAGLSGEQAAVARQADSLASSLGAAHHLGTAHVALVSTAFAHAMDIGLWVAAGVSAVTALIVLRAMPARPSRPARNRWSPEQHP
jgi:EmrB/QacA subfamily drug resistance transporter